MTTPPGPSPVRQGSPRPLPSSGVREKLLLLVGLRRRYRVEGPSMEPSLREGDEILADPRAYRRRGPASGEVVVALHPFRSSVRMVKRVAAVAPDGACDLRGDHPGGGTDSRALGNFPPSALLARVTSVLARTGTGVEDARPTAG